MSVNFTVTVYQINDNQPIKTPFVMGFPAAQSVFRPAPSGTKAANGTTDLYGIVQLRPSGLSVSSDQFYVVETVLALSAKANA